MAALVPSVPVDCPLCGDRLDVPVRVFGQPVIVGRAVKVNLRADTGRVELHLAEKHGRPGPDGDDAPYALPAAA